jgi:hypothetical protein
MNDQLQVQNALTSFDATWDTTVALPDPEAAEALNARFALWNQMEDLQRRRSFAERGLIILEFERRNLWQHLVNPDTESPFTSMNAWLSCSRFLGCRRTNYAAKRVLKQLEDVEDKSKLIDVPSASLHVLTGVSTAVRNLPEVLDAAKEGEDKLLEALDQKHPMQHIQTHRNMLLRLTRDERESVNRWIEYAIESDLAASPSEAVVLACESALQDVPEDKEC